MLYTQETINAPDLVCSFYLTATEFLQEHALSYLSTGAEAFVSAQLQSHSALLDQLWVAPKRAVRNWVSSVTTVLKPRSKA